MAKAAASWLSRPGSAQASQPPTSPLAELTDRERTVLELVAAGQSNVKYYMTNILQKLQVRNRVEAALLLRQAGGM